MSGGFAQHALLLAAKGFRVFPLAVGSKKPCAGVDWRAVATTDPAWIASKWEEADYNIGVMCGNGLMGLDIDTKGGKLGMQSLQALGLPKGALNTFLVNTWSGGLHAYLHTALDVGNSAGSRLGPGLDVRGARGYLVGPGSVVNGVPYTIRSDAPLAECPVEILSRLAAPVPRDDTTPLVEQDQASAVERGVDYLSTAPLAIENAGGDHTTFTVAARLKDFGLSEPMALDLLAEHWNDRCEPPWSLDDLETKVGNAYRYGSRAPGVDHPAVEFKGVQVAPPPRETSRWLRHGDAWEPDAAWLYPDLFPSVGVVLLVAPPQAGKTFIGLELVRCTATGGPFFGIKPDETGGSLLVFAGTEGSGLARRLAALGETTPLPISALIVGSLSDAASLRALEAELVEESIRMALIFDVRVRLVILETLSASGLVKDENDNAEVSRALAALAAMGRRLNVLFLVSHHPGKTGNGARGASALIGSADVVIEIEREGTAAVRSLIVTKAREAEQRALGSFTLVPVHLGEDYKGRPVKSLAVSMGEPITVAQAQAKHAPLLLECLEWALMGESAAQVGEDYWAPKSTVWEIFNERCSSITLQRHRNGAFNTAIKSLEASGLLDSLQYAGEKHYRAKEISL